MFPKILILIPQCKTITKYVNDSKFMHFTVLEILSKNLFQKAFTWEIGGVESIGLVVPTFFSKVKFLMFFLN